MPGALPTASVDLSWFDAFKGTHKQVFDLQRFDLSLDTPLRLVVTYLATHRELNKLEPPDDTMWPSEFPTSRFR